MGGASKPCPAGPWDGELHHLPEGFLFPLPGCARSAEMMGNAELAPDVDVGALEPLLSPDVVAELLDTYMSTLTVSGGMWAHVGRVGLQPGPIWPLGFQRTRGSF